MKMRFWIGCLLLLLSLGVGRIEAQEKFRFPIGESSKTLSYGPLWVAAKIGFFEKEGLDVPIVTMRGSHPELGSGVSCALFEVLPPR